MIQSKGRSDISITHSNNTKPIRMLDDTKQRLFGSLKTHSNKTKLIRILDDNIKNSFE